MGIKLTSNIHKFIADLEKADKARIKAAQTAVRVEAYNQAQQLKEEIREGAPGGRSFSPLSQIAMARKSARAAKSPLSRMATQVRYSVDKGGNQTTYSFGFGVHGAYSARWIYLAKQHQAGFTRPVTEDMRRGLIAMAARLKRSKKDDKRSSARFFFLRKSTTQIDIPARPIIGPFWQAHKAQAEQNIALNFYRKMRGERI
jgi:hypothetical protein